MHDPFQRLLLLQPAHKAMVLARAYNIFLQTTYVLYGQLALVTHFSSNPTLYESYVFSTPSWSENMIMSIDGPLQQATI
jgi:hypothetical protein